ncbi:hypothetical protein HBI24_177910 [Parastagonospora nodorum]|nr:hypothetical protein HBH51_181480 [Parastagonospora nodorum]KAH4024693.1 hypothetical protein HBI09_157200 [Parastagonospora nodorum]KAH4045994.1 hypothetical protein HBH49_192020 [Parastagonospora nodorum]KAH4060165.1 hypothetical protein HBH50_223040 [Parastagonospora nodorum]KAH4132083.1 hypothetical protein HBH45_185950 [Parastagonospora nodorum]
MLDFTWRRKSLILVAASCVHGWQIASHKAPASFQNFDAQPPCATLPRPQRCTIHPPPLVSFNATAPRIFPTGFPQRSDVADSFLLTAHWQLLPAAATPSLVPLLHPCMAYSPCLAHTPRTPALFTRQDLRSQLYPRSIHPPACAVANTPSPHI